MKFSDKAQYLRYLVDRRGMKPIYMILGLTYDCNSFCRTCFNWEQLRKNKEHELSFEEIQKTFASLDDLLFVVMSGGEPFLRRDLPEVCAMLSEQNHVKQITVPTGAISSDLIAKSTEQTLQRCPSTQIVVNLSIDHIGEKHDWIRGVPGNYEKAKKTYAHLVALRERFTNLTVNVHTCLCNYNVDGLDFIFENVRSDFPAISFHSFEMLRGDQPDKNIHSAPRARGAGAGDAGAAVLRGHDLRCARRARGSADVRAARGGRQRARHRLRLRQTLVFA